MTLSNKGADFISKEEGFKPCPYLDSVKVPTIGIGTTVYPNGKSVTMTDPCIDLDKAKMYLQYHVQNKVIKYIQPLIKTNLNQNQVDAIISLVYNIGAGGFAKSTLLKRINKDPMDSTGITEAFLMWKNAGGKPILLKRRKREVALYFS